MMVDMHYKILNYKNVIIYQRYNYRLDNCKAVIPLSAIMVAPDLLQVTPVYLNGVGRLAYNATILPALCKLSTPIEAAENCV